MVAMAMGDEDMTDAADDVVVAPFKAGIAREEWIDQDCLVAEIEPERRVSEPGNLHGSLPRGAPSRARAAPAEWL